MNIEQYLSKSNPLAVQGILMKYGQEQAQTWDELPAKLRSILGVYKDAVAKDMAAIDTPYKKLILATTEPVIVEKEVKVEVPTEKKSNADGGCQCGGKCGGSNNNQATAPQIFYRADGSTTNPAPNNDHVKYIQPLLIAAAAFGLGYLIAKK